MKNLMNLKGAKLLSKTEQKNVFGGFMSGMCSDQCQTNSDCTQKFGKAGECFVGTCDNSPTRMCKLASGGIE